MSPKVSILVVTYLKENQRYLDLCLKSIQGLDYPKEDLDVLVLSTGDYEPETHGFRSVHTTQRMHFPEGVNFGVKLLEPSKYILILNDDVMITKNSLRAMVNSAGDGDFIVGPISNCDSGWQHMLGHMGYMDGNNFIQFPKRFYRYDDVKDIADKMMSTQVMATPGLWRQSWIAFYAVLIPRKIWDMVGGLDPRFLTGNDDLDFCLRCRQHGVRVFIEQSALIWHAGGVTADIALTDQVRTANTKYFEEKWGHNPGVHH